MIDYLALGRHDLNGKMSASGVPSEDIDSEQKIDMLTITVGLRF